MARILGRMLLSSFPWRNFKGSWDRPKRAGECWGYHTSHPIQGATARRCSMGSTPPKNCTGLHAAGHLRCHVGWSKTFGEQCNVVSYIYNIWRTLSCHGNLRCHVGLLVIFWFNFPSEEPDSFEIYSNSYGLNHWKSSPAGIQIR